MQTTRFRLHAAEQTKRLQQPPCQGTKISTRHHNHKIIGLRSQSSAVLGLYERTGYDSEKSPTCNRQDRLLFLLSLCDKSSRSEKFNDPRAKKPPFSARQWATIATTVAVCHCMSTEYRFVLTSVLVDTHRSDFRARSARFSQWCKCIRGENAVYLFSSCRETVTPPYTMLSCCTACIYSRQRCF